MITAYANRSRNCAIVSNRLKIIGSLITCASVFLACKQEANVPPEQLQQNLDDFREFVQSDYYKCPYPVLRVNTEPLVAGVEPGWVLLVFDVSGAGAPLEIEVVESSLGAAFQVAAIEHTEETLRFRPVAVGSVGKVFNNWFERVDFLPEGGVPKPSWPDPKTYFAVDCAN